MSGKVCTSCEKLCQTHEFYRRARSHDGLTARCGACISHYQATEGADAARKYRANNRARIRAARDPVKDRKRLKAWRKENPTKYRAQQVRAQPRQSAWMKAKYREDAGYRSNVLWQRKSERRVLASRYVAAQITKKSLLRRKDIPFTLIEAKRAYLEVHRLVTEKTK